MSKLYLLLALLLFTGCNNGKQAAKTVNAPAQQSQPALTVCLVRSDCGMADILYCREADAALAEAAKQGLVSYQPVGELPTPIEERPGTANIALPQAGSADPGTMTVDEASVLLEQVQPCDWLVLTTPLLAAPALQQCADGKLQAKLILLLDDDGMVGTLPQSPVPLLRVRYDIKHMAFLCGVAAAASSVNGQFVILGSSADPQDAEFIKAASAGAGYQTNGAIVRSAIVQAGPDGLLSAQAISESLSGLLQDPGGVFKPNNYIIALGRATPSVINGLCLPPNNGYVACGYADYRALWPERTIGCALKHPGKALSYLLQQYAQGTAPLEMAKDGLILLGLDEDVLGFTGIELYSRFNADGEDIGDAVKKAEGFLRAGELGVPY